VLKKKEKRWGHGFAYIDYTPKLTNGT